MKKVMPIGYEDIREIVDKDLYYVDKSLMIKDLLDFGGKVNLFMRPRRFGKTLNLSMIRRFFEIEIDSRGNRLENRDIFEHLKIASCGAKYMNHQGQYPVINLSLKSAKQPTFDMAYKSLVDEIAKEFKRHYYVLGADTLTDEEKDQYQLFMNRKAEEIDNAKSLEFLSYCLAEYHQKKVIILIDEYDVPLEHSYFTGFYDNMISFIRSLFESAFKTNSRLEFAVITGCLRISRESIFTGLNNLKIHSVLAVKYEDSFGFSETEIQSILEYFELKDKYKELKSWYNGYLFGEKEIYNPWSIINYVDDVMHQHDAFPRPYWSNTSSNSIIRELVEQADFETRKELESLIEGTAIEKPIHEDITYGDIYESRDNLWNFLFFTGYLRKAGECQREEIIYLKLTIPNAEIRSIYRNTILAWFDKKIQKSDMAPLFKAIDDGDCEGFEEFLSGQLLDTISFFDYAENYYHGFLAGLLKTSQKYYVYSNRESGTGRSDIILKTPSVRGSAVVMELKVSNTFDKMEDLCREALMQIEERDYEASLRTEGYRNILKYGICFYRKECMVMKAELC